MYNNTLDIAEDYADRIIGAGVAEPLHLAEYYYRNPQEIPDPIKPELFLAHFKKIFNIIKRRSMYHTIENQEVVEHYWDYIAKQLPKGLKSDSKILNAARKFIGDTKGHSDSVLVSRDKNLSNKIVSSYKSLGFHSSEEEESPNNSWWHEQETKMDNTSISELIDDLVDCYEVINSGDIGSYSYDTAQLDADMIYDNLIKRGVSKQVLTKIWDEVEARS